MLPRPSGSSAALRPDTPAGFRWLTRKRHRCAGARSQNTLSTVKVTIIGAGVIGCAAAYELTRRGAEVVLLDMRQPGGGATQASAGMLTPHLEGESAALLQLGIAGLARYDEFVRDLRAVSGRDVEYRREGTVEVALTEAEVEALRGRAARYDAMGVAHRFVEGPEAHALDPSLPSAVRGALVVPEHGYVGVRSFAAALLATAERAGARVAIGARVERITTEGAVTRVHTDRETVDADVVVVAAGSWFGQVPVDGVTSEAVRPVRGQLLQLSMSHPPTSRVLWSRSCYLVPWTDGTLLVGATVEDVGFDEHATAAGVSGLLGAAFGLLPSTRTARFDGVRVGLRPATRDHLPIIGRSAVAPGVVYATGHYRSGILLAPLTAEMVADLVLDGQESPHLEHTRPGRFGL